MSNRFQSLGTWLVLWLVIVSAIKPLPIWDYIDPLLWLATDGDWILADIVLYVLGTVLCLVLVAGRLPFRDWPWAVLLPWLAYAMWAAVNIAWLSRFPRYSWHEWFHEVLPAGAVLLVGYAVTATRWGASQEWRLLAGVSMVVIVGALLYYRRYLPFGPFDHVLFSTWAIYLLPLGYVLLAQEQVRQREIALAVVLLLMCGLVTQNRVFWLVALLQIVLVALGLRCVGAEPAAPWAWRRWAVAFAALSVIGYLYTAQFKPDSYLAGAGEAGAAGGWWKIFLRTERYRIYSFWLEQGGKSPWAGIGFGWRMPSVVYGRFMPKDFPPIFISHGHNVLLNQWLQLGLLGLALYLGWLGAVAWRAVKLAREGTRTLRPIGVFLIAMLAGLLVKNFTDDGMRGGNILLFWLLVGGALGLGKWHDTCLRSRAGDNVHWGGVCAGAGGLP